MHTYYTLSINNVYIRRMPAPIYALLDIDIMVSSIIYIRKVQARICSDVHHMCMHIMGCFVASWPPGACAPDNVSGAIRSQSPPTLYDIVLGTNKHTRARARKKPTYTMSNAHSLSACVGDSGDTHAETLADVRHIVW